MIGLTTETVLRNQWKVLSSESTVASRNKKVWLITGTSRGFGRVWAAAALKRGDKVAATARNTDSLKQLVDSYGEAILPIELDVTNHDEDFSAVERAYKHFGRLDVVVNNAGYGLLGAVEEVSEAEARAELETNFFGALWITQAALPILRRQGSGHIVQISSLAGIAAFPGVGLYHASKWALEGLSEALSQEVGRFGVKVTIIEPGSYSTDWAGSSAKHAAKNQAYEGMHVGPPTAGHRRGNPEATVGAILKIVDSDNPPLRVLLGDLPVDLVKQVYLRRLATWAEWEEVSRAASGT